MKTTKSKYSSSIKRRDSREIPKDKIRWKLTVWRAIVAVAYIIITTFSMAGNFYFFGESQFGYVTTETGLVAIFILCTLAWFLTDNLIEQKHNWENKK